MDNIKALTMTVIANITANYDQGLGNVSMIQKLFPDGRPHGTRSSESLTNAILTQAGFLDDLQTVVNGATQKFASEEVNAATCRALESGYLMTIKNGPTIGRARSITISPAIDFDPFTLQPSFHNNLSLARNFANANELNVQTDAGKVGLMPHSYEFNKSLKAYSVTLDLTRIGVDENFHQEADAEEKAFRVKALLRAIQTLTLTVKGSLDNAEPIFVVGGLSDRKTHYFENCVHVKNGKLDLNRALLTKLSEGYSCGYMECGIFDNEVEVLNRLNPPTVNEFFKAMEADVDHYYSVGGAAQ